MEPIKTYKTNRFLAFVITLMGLAIIFSIDLDRLQLIHQDPWGLFFVAFWGLLNPMFFLFGFSTTFFRDEVIAKSYIVFRKRFKINDISHVLYQPTWRGVTSLDSNTTMRTLHIVRHSGGWRDTISLANGAYREADLADIAKRLQQMNPRIEFDEHAQALIKKHEQS